MHNIHVNFSAKEHKYPRFWLHCRQWPMILTWTWEITLKWEIHSFHPFLWRKHWKFAYHVISERKPSQNREDVYLIITPKSFLQVSWPIIEIIMFIKINEFLQNIGIPTVCSRNINAEGVVWKFIGLWSSMVYQETCVRKLKASEHILWFSVQKHLRLYNKLFLNVFWTEMELFPMFRWYLHNHWPLPASEWLLLLIM